MVFRAAQERDYWLLIVMKLKIFLIYSKKPNLFLSLREPKRKWLLPYSDDSRSQRWWFRWNSCGRIVAWIISKRNKGNLKFKFMIHARQLTVRLFFPAFDASPKYEKNKKRQRSCLPSWWFIQTRDHWSAKSKIGKKLWHVKARLESFSMFARSSQTSLR